MKMHVYLNKLVNNKRYIRSFIDFGFHLVMYSVFYSKLLILELSRLLSPFIFSQESQDLAEGNLIQFNDNGV